MELLEKIIDFITKKEVYSTILFIICGYLVYKFVSIFFEKIIVSGKTEYERKKRKTIIDLFKNIFKYLIVILVVLFILNLYGYNIKTLVAGLGIAATVLGLALQDALKDLIGGITIILENYYVTGDYVRYNNFSGEVIELSLKCTKIKSFDGEVLTIANRNVVEIINLSQKEAHIMISIPIAYEEDIEDVEKVINDVILPKSNNIKDVRNGSATYLGIEKLDNSCVNYLVSINCKQESQWQVRRDFTRLILSSLKENKIKIPYPQIEVHNAKD
ncbi:MAG: mechanosensitive ion channel family protein [Bacilli bacterium]